MRLDKTSFRWAAKLVAFGVVLAWLIGSLKFPANSVSILWGLAYPFLLGFAIAFLLNLPMKLVNRWLLRGRGGRLNRFFCLLIVLLLFLLAVFLLLFILVPQLVKSVSGLVDAFPGYLQNLQAFLQPYAARIPALEQALQGLNVDIGSLASTASQKLLPLLQSGGSGLWGSISAAASSFFSGIASFVIAVFFAFNLVLGKEHWLRGLDGLMRAYLSYRAYERLCYVGRLANRTFSKYVGGQFLEALVVALVFLPILAIGGFPYALLVSVLVFITSFIPVFGAYIAAVIGAFLILLSAGFWRMLAFVIIFVILQTLDGNILYPKIVGNSVGLKPGWILVAVAVGGGLFGIPGILLFIPLLSVVYQLVYRDANERIARKKAAGIPVPEAGEYPCDSHQKAGNKPKK